MAFIRIKKIKDKPYAYLVKNKWTKKGPRQCSSKYLGPVLKLGDDDKEIEFRNYVFTKFKEELESFFEKNTSKEILNEIIFFELSQKGFKKYIGKKGTKKDSMINKNIVLDLNYLKVYDVETKKSAVININSDFLCEYTLKKLYNFWEHGTEVEIAKKLAKTFISCGIGIEDEVFVLFFKKCFKDDSLKIL